LDAFSVQTHSKNQTSEIMEESEKETNSFLTVEDAQLAKDVRTCVRAMKDHVDKNRGLLNYTSAQCLVNSCIGANAQELTVNVGGVSVNSVNHGDWKITVERVK
jgi:hypothetical protein